MTFFVQETGDPAAPTIVFFHGAGTSSWMWQAQMRDLPDYHCLAVDLPGHGGSNQIPWVSLADTAAQVAELIRQRAEGGRAHVVGLSLGAYIATQLLSEHPERIDHAVLSGLTVLPLPNAGLMKIMGYVMAPLLKTRPMIRANAKALRIPAEQYAGYAAAMRQMAVRTYLRIGNDLLRFRTPTNLSTIDRPTLLVAGEREHPIILRSCGLVAATMPQASGRMVPGAGHGWSGERPELFNATVRAWINDAPLPTELEPLPAPKQPALA